MPIPKVIHFIWAGGEKLLPDINIERIKTWSLKNPDFEIWLWIDKKSTSQENLDIYSSSDKFGANPKIILKDITEENVVDECSRYHIDRLVPNYGASSDLLRYSIELKFGGAMFDSDIIVTNETKPLNYSGLFDSDEQDIIRISQYTQNHDAIGNDAFICTPNHPFMREVYETAKFNHQKESNSITSPYGFDMHQKFDWTIENTGPALIIQVCKNNNMLEEEKINDVHIKFHQRIKDASLKLDRSCYMPAASNDKNWLISPPRKCSNIDEAIKITIESISFEIKNFGLLRIDDHITNIVNALNLNSSSLMDLSKINRCSGDTTNDERNIAEKLILELANSKLDLSNCKLIQLISRYQCVADYYQKFTPKLHDGDIQTSKTALTNMLININNENRKLIINNYLSHLNNQQIHNNNTNHKVPDESHTNLMKSNIDTFVGFNIRQRRNKDLSLSQDDLFGLNEKSLPNHEITRLKTLKNLLIDIIRYIRQNNNTNLDMSLPEKWIVNHIYIYPENKQAITSAIYKLYKNEILFDNKDIIFDDNVVDKLYKLYEALENKSLEGKYPKEKINTHIPPTLTSPLSPALFQHQVNAPQNLHQSNDNNELSSFKKSNK